MTEIQRIIEKGKIPASFLQEETKCDFFVNNARKKLWTVQLDLLMEFDKVCKKNGLQYFMHGGSLLGTIRHSGFIPWDDDIDLYMFREDYDRLTKLLKEEFHSPYFLQTPYTDDGYYYAHTRLVNINTSAICYDFRYQEFKQGIYIAIFPLDNCRLDDLQVRYNKIKKLILDNSTYMRMSDPNPNEANKIRIQQHSGRHPMDVYEEIVAVATQYKNEKTDYVNSAMCTVYAYNVEVYEKRAFNEVIYRSFEGFEVPVPKEYDYILTQLYGNYMEFPPEDKRVGHTKVITNTDIAYGEFIKTLR